MSGFFQDDKDNSSSYRLVMVMFFGTLCAAYLAVTAANIYIALAANAPATITLVDVGTGVIGMAGLVLVGKTAQKAIENKGPQVASPKEGG